MSEIHGIILDLDGTLIDSNDAHAMAWKDALDELGLRTSFVEIRRSIGMGSDQLLPKLAGVEKNSIRGREVSDLRAKIFRDQYFPQLKPFPYSQDLILKMREEGYRLIVASSAEKWEVDGLLKKIDIQNLVEFCITGEDVPESKPSPQEILLALEKLKLSPSEVLMIGDTPYDIYAAKQAGVKTIAFRTGGWSDQDLKGAIAIYDNPQDAYVNFENAPWTRRAHKTAA